MSRVSRRKRIKRIRKREFLKSSLIALLIGIIGTIGSFAYFKSKATVEPNLIIKPGTLKVVLKNKSNVNKDTSKDKSIVNINGINESNKTKETIFYIKNEGTLNEKINLNFGKANLNDAPRDLLEKLKYKLSIVDEKDNPIKLEVKSEGILNDLINYKNTTKVINNLKLNSKEQLKCTLKISLKDAKNMNAKYSKSKIRFVIDAKASQTIS